MNAAVPMESCPDHETLSAFIDQQLDPKSRLDVVTHLGECGDCRDLVVAAYEYAREGTAESGRVVRSRFGSRWAVPLAAAAAIVIVSFGVMSLRERSGMPALIEAANALPERTVEARLSGDFAYKEYRPKRGVGENTPAEVAEYQLSLAADNAEERAMKSRTSANLHIAGVGRILTKEPTTAVEVLLSATSTTAPSADVLTDLSAAYMARAGKGDYELALDAANRALALERTPAAAWNRALALQWLGRDREAVSAWQQYLRLDPSSRWAQEVRTERLPDLQEQ